MDYVLHISILCMIFSILAWSLDLIAGHSGMLSAAQAGFFGVGAYASTLLTLELDLGFGGATVMAMLISASVSVIISAPATRLQGDYFVIATFAFQMILFSVFNNWMELTRGPLGIPGIPRPSVFGIAIDSEVRFLFLAACATCVAGLVVHRLSGGAYGRVLHALREDEPLARSLGKNTNRVKMTTFAVSAALAGLAGSLYARHISFIDPTSFTIVDSVLIIAMVVVGGAGNWWGPLVGALILILLPELLRFMGLPIALAAALRQIIYGLALVLLMLFRPQGLVGRYNFS